MKRLLCFLIVATFGIWNPVHADHLAQIAVDLGEAWESNADHTVDYRWGSLVEVAVNNQAKLVLYRKMEVDDDGELKSEVMDASKAPGAKTPVDTDEGRDLAGDMLELLDKVSQPTTSQLVTFFEKAMFAPGRGPNKGALILTSKNYLHDGDSMTMAVDATDHQPRRLEYKDETGASPFSAVIIYESLPNGMFYPKEITVELPRKNAMGKFSIFAFDPLDGDQSWAEDYSDIEWPREFQEGGSLMVIYQPQLEVWDNYNWIQARAAVGVKGAGASEMTMGSIKIEASTSTNMDSRLVRVSGINISEAAFPDVPEDKMPGVFEALDKAFPEDTVIVSLDRLLASLAESDQEPEPVRTTSVSYDVPRILVTDGPTEVVILEGKAQMDAIAGTSLRQVINTAWDLFLDSKGKKYYILYGDGWLESATLEGDWVPTSGLPADFSRLNGPEWKWLEENVPGEKLLEAPRLVITDEPTEVIAIDGKPVQLPIPLTKLIYVDNTESDLFLHYGDNHWYALLSGRWFKAPDLKGPWTANPASELPADFARIPQNHDKSHVLVSVAGTEEAEEAVLMTQIPQKATVSRSEPPEVQVQYEGEPEFSEIEGTSLTFATNTPSDVIGCQNKYYLCQEGVWFEATSATGPWVLCTEVPDEIYNMPANSPKYNVTYVTVYDDSSEDEVVYGYTSGYDGYYVDDGVVLYGTGFYYYYPWGYYRCWHRRYPHYWRHYHRWRCHYPYGRRARYSYRHRGYVYRPAAGRHVARRGAYRGYHRPANAYSGWKRGVSSRNNFARAGHTTARRATGSTARASARTTARRNNVYAGNNGKVYRRSNGRWQTNKGGKWQNVPKKTRPKANARAGTARNNPRTGQRASNRGVPSRVQRESNARRTGNQRAKASQKRTKTHARPKRNNTSVKRHRSSGRSSARRSGGARRGGYHGGVRRGGGGRRR